MPIPTQTEMFGIVLGLMADGENRSRNDMKRITLKHLGLTGEEAVQKTSSGVPVYESRVGWAMSHLSRARFIQRVERGVYAINDDGRNALAENLGADALWQRMNDRIKLFESQEYGEQPDGKKAPESAHPDTASPQEQITALAAQVDDALADELLSAIMGCSPSFFEHVVVQLLEKMGYGRGEVTQRSNDGGIDGLITTDELGFRPIYTQAKHYSADNKVGRPLLQSFAGALNGVSNGVFITTSSFTDDAIEYAKNYPHAAIALIDGRKLAQLMIKYGLGATTERVVEIKHIDNDYFEE